MPDTYFTRKEAIAHGEAIDPITREEALIQKTATPLSVKDAALYALKDGGSTPSPSDFSFVRLIINGAQSLSDLSSDSDSSVIALTLEGTGIILVYDHTFLPYDAGQQVLDVMIPIPLSSEKTLYIETGTNSGIYEPQLTYTGLSYIGDNNYSITRDTVTIYVGAKLGGK